MHSWQTTRNTYEAAALAALDIPLKPVTMRDFKTGTEYTDWNLAPNNQAVVTGEPARSPRLYLTGPLRRDFNGGKLQGELAAQPLHPYLLALRALHNRQRLLEAQKGRAMALKEAAPGSYILEPGSATPPLPPTLDTADLDLAVALISIGCDLVSITHNGNGHVYRLTRYSATKLDAGTLMHDLRANLLFPARRWEPFALAIHTLHCLRELRKHQHSDQYITVRHRTYLVRGAAFKANAPSHIQSAVQQRLGIKL